MAGLEGLASIIYHEKQQPGSMLCAQHALNSLLQGNYFTAPDLSDIARSLDALEESYDDDNMGRSSTNMDDTGFFSVQVLENALNVWGLSLVRWRSEIMRPHQDEPDSQQAFVLNLQQHWFTLRRFGSSQSSAASPGHWFNLNSFLENPEWVSRLYLGMVLKQAEEEGYSVFAVRPLDRTASPLLLPRTEADDVAATLPEPTSASSSSRLNMSRVPSHSSASTSQNPPAPGLEGFEDEDMELQAALQASLMAGDAIDFVLPPRAPQIPTLPLPDPITPPGLAPAAPISDPDPVAASMARNRAIMDRMRREQEMALREGYEEEVARFQATARDRRARSRHVGPAASAGGSGVEAGEEEDEDELVRRAIAESQATAEVEGHPTLQPDDDDDDEDDEYMDLGGSRPPPSLPLPVPPPAPSFARHRVYDDDDAELQAALKASLEGVPDGYVVPDFPAPPHPSRPAPAPAPATASTKPPPQTQTEDDTDETEGNSSIVSETTAEEEEQVSVDEMRRRRLARFGG